MALNCLSAICGIVQASAERATLASAARQSTGPQQKKERLEQSISFGTINFIINCDAQRAGPPSGQVGIVWRQQAAAKNLLCAFGVEIGKGVQALLRA
jgi:hypothetical protein